jgi:hypothetical protein
MARQPAKEWEVVFDDDFQAEFELFDEAVRDKILIRAGVLRYVGPNLARPYADTLEGSKYANMKELRAPVGDEVWRVAYAFDRKRRSILLCAGNKQGKNQKKFYKDLIALADERFARYG